MLEILQKLLRPARKQNTVRADYPGTSSAPRVFAGMIVCLIVAGLLSSARLVDMADRQEFGPSRDRWLTAAERVDEVARSIGLDQPAVAADRLLGRAGSPDAVVLGELAPTRPSPPVDPTPSTVSPTSTAPPTPTTSSPPTTTPTTTTTTTLLGNVSAEDPLRIWVGGDSLGEYVGSHVTRAASEWVADIAWLQILERWRFAES